MNRPYLFCHRMTSLDGKIMGSYMETPEDKMAGMCDELSVVMTAAADGSSETPALFETRGGLATPHPVSFVLQGAEVKDGGGVWLHYLVKPASREVV